MFRRALFDRSRRPNAEDTFRWRGENVSRLENLSDIVFALAISLLIARPDVPLTFADLVELLQGFVPLAGGFFIILVVWQMHYTFFRRYDLSDGRTVSLNAVLLFVVLLFVYPLRFLADFQAKLLFGRFESWVEVSQVVTLTELPWLQVVYSGGYAAVFAVFALLYRHAAQCADDLDLSPAERVLTDERIALSAVHVGIGVVAIVLGFGLPALWKPMSWIAYVLIWPMLVLVRRPFRRRLAVLTNEQA